MALVIDRSGSMEEGGAIELAKEATRRAVHLLQPRDRLGVIAFQDYAEWVSPLRPCSDKRAVLEGIRRQRRKALAYLQQRGALGADLPPSMLASGTLERYLEVKRRGLL